MQDIDFEAGVWAIVTVTGGTQYIGSVSGNMADEERILEWIAHRKLLRMDQVYQLVSQHMPVQNPETGQTGFQRLCRCAPVNNCLGASKLRITVEGIHFFSDMQDADREQHKSLVRQLEQMLIAARLKAAGIEIPTQKGPSGPIVRP